MNQTENEKQMKHVDPVNSSVSGRLYLNDDINRWKRKVRVFGQRNQIKKKMCIKNCCTIHSSHSFIDFTSSSRFLCEWLLPLPNIYYYFYCINWWACVRLLRTRCWQKPAAGAPNRRDNFLWRNTLNKFFMFRRTINEQTKRKCVARVREWCVSA